MQRASAPQPSLSQSLGRLTATGFTVGAIIGAGIFGSTGPATESAGSGVLLSIVLAAIVSIATAMSGVQCGAAYPKPGGAYTWSRIFGFETTAFVAGCCFLAKEIVGPGFIALTFAVYLNRAIPG